MPCDCRSRNADADFSALRPTISTVAPDWPIPRAIPRPMPPLPPVTSAIFDVRSNMRSSIIPAMRQIVLDTETTGLSAEAGDRIIEIGYVELVARKLTGNNKHWYLNPERDSHE